MKKIEIYSTPTCMYCNIAKDFFNKNKVSFTEYDVSTDISKRHEMVEKSGQMGVPVIVVEGKDVIVGFDEPTLRQLLAIK